MGRFRQFGENLVRGYLVWVLIGIIQRMQFQNENRKIWLKFDYLNLVKGQFILKFGLAKIRFPQNS